MFPSQAHLGGVPSRKGQVQAYLRLREHDLGPLDFDTPGGIDTTWHRIYLCLRSAFYPEAIEVRSPYSLSRGGLAWILHWPFAGKKFDRSEV